MLLEREAGTQGEVVVEFLVKEDGSVADISVRQGGELNAETMRVVSIMPMEVWRAAWKARKRKI